MKLSVLSGTTLLSGLALAAPTEAPNGPSLTVYNKNFGVVRERVALELEAGVNAVSFSGVTSQMEPESVVLRDPGGSVALRVLEQSYRADPVDTEGLLKMFEGEVLLFEREIGDKIVMVEGRVVRAPQSPDGRGRHLGSSRGELEPIIEVDGQLLTRLPGKPQFPSLGDDSILKPTLSWRLHVPDPVSVDAELSYLTGGISWKSDYNLVLPEHGDVVTLTGWVSITNATGKTFEDATVKLIAGEVNKVVEVVPMMARNEVLMDMGPPPPPPEVEARKFDEFHLYSLPLATTLRDRETKQVEFVRAEGVETRKRYLLETKTGRFYGGLNTNRDFGVGSDQVIGIYREFENTVENGLGIALPAGRVRFYRMDRDGQMEFTGENQIDHTPKDERIRVYLGNAFDLVGERTQKNFYKYPSRDMIQETFEIEIRNRSEETVTVEVIEPLYRWSNWKITETSRTFEKLDAQTIRYDVEVAAGAVETVLYTVEYNW